MGVVVQYRNFTSDLTLQIRKLLFFYFHFVLVCTPVIACAIATFLTAVITGGLNPDD